MDTTDKIIQTNYGYRKNLIANQKNPRYLYEEHQVDNNKQSNFRNNLTDHRSFVVIQGEIILEFLQENGDRTSQSYGKLEGWHALPGSIYRIRNESNQPSVLIEGGSISGEDTDIDCQNALITNHPPTSCKDISPYKVEKPWGEEIWFTHNIREDLPYALKKIGMNAGNQSSLQSHEVKMETNYVIEGEATVLSGIIAPEDLNAVIELETLKSKKYQHGLGWSSEHRELHRVIAKSNYISIEISTPELDDVIRWQDDTNRGSGRIESEHSLK